MLRLGGGRVCGRAVSRLAPQRAYHTAACRPAIGQSVLRTGNPSGGFCRRRLCTKPASGEANAGAKTAPAKAASATATAAAEAATAAEAAATTEAVAAPLFVPSEWMHWGAAIGAFYVANDVLYKGFSAAGINFPASLVGMFGILGGLWTLSAVGQGAMAGSIVAAAAPALKWITRYLPVFYVPALVVLPLAVEKLSGAELGKITAVLGLGMPFSLFTAGAIVMAIRRLTTVSMLSVRCGPAVAPPPS